MSQFRNKAEAQQAIQDMKQRAAKAAERAYLGLMCNSEASQEYLAEADRIESLLPTLPD